MLPSTFCSAMCLEYPSRKFMGPGYHTAKTSSLNFSSFLPLLAFRKGIQHLITSLNKNRTLVWNTPRHIPDEKHSLQQHVSFVGHSFQPPQVGCGFFVPFYFLFHAPHDARFMDDKSTDDESSCAEGIQYGEILRAHRARLQQIALTVGADGGRTCTEYHKDGTSARSAPPRGISSVCMLWAVVHRAPAGWNRRLTAGWFFVFQPAFGLVETRYTIFSARRADATPNGMFGSQSRRYIRCCSVGSANQ